MFVLLSGLAKRIARVWASGSPSLTSADVFHTQLLSLPTLGESFISGTTSEKWVSISNVIHYMQGLTVVISANFVSLVSSHNKPGLAIFLVLEKFDIASPTLFPLAGIFIKLEEFGTPCANTN